MKRLLHTQLQTIKNSLVKTIKKPDWLQTRMVRLIFILDRNHRKAKQATGLKQFLAKVGLWHYAYMDRSTTGLITNGGLVNLS